MDDDEVSPWITGAKQIERKLNSYDKFRAANGLQPMTDHERELAREWLVQSLTGKSAVDILDRGEAFLSVDDEQIRLKKARSKPFNLFYSEFNFVLILILSLLWGILLVDGASQQLGPLLSITYFVGSVAGFLNTYAMLTENRIGFIRRLQHRQN